MLDFPAAPTNGQIYSAANNIVYQFLSTPAPGVWIALPGTGTTPGGDFCATQDVGLPAGISSVPVTLTPNTIISGNSGNWYVPATGRYTPPPGRYFISGSYTGYWSGGAISMICRLRKNGGQINYAYPYTAAANYRNGATIEAVVNANGTDWFDFQVMFEGAAGTFESATFLAYSTGGMKGAQGEQGLQGIQGVQGTPGVAGGGGDIPVGGIIDYGGANAPAGWLLCDGGLYLRASYPNLFTAISTAFNIGGELATQFRVPDLAGRVTAGKEATATRLTVAGAGFSGATLAAAGGAQTHILTTAQLAAHGHNYTDPGHAHGMGPAGTVVLSLTNGDVYWARLPGGEGGTDVFYTYSMTNVGTGITISNSGSGSAHQNTQPTMIMNKIIKT